MRWAVRKFNGQWWVVDAFGAALQCDSWAQAVRVAFEAARILGLLARR